MCRHHAVMYSYKHAWKSNTLHYIGDLVNKQYIQYDDNTPEIRVIQDQLK